MKYLAACLLLSTATALSQPATGARETADRAALKVFSGVMEYYGNAKYAEGQSSIMLLSTKEDPANRSGKTETLEEILATLKDDATKGMNIVEHFIDNPSPTEIDRITTKHISKLALEGSRSFTSAAKNYEQVIEIIRNYHR